MNYVSFILFLLIYIVYKPRLFMNNISYVRYSFLIIIDFFNSRHARVSLQFISGGDT